MALRYLLDTNVLSLLDPRRAEHRGHLPVWLDRHGTELALAAITLTEIENGILKLRRLGQTARAGEIEALASAIRKDFADRILPLDAATAVAIAHCAERARPMVIELPDLIVAATAEVNGLAVLTRNLRHIEPTGVAAIDPVATPPGD
ncbi:PIN domain-containing protein [Tabrizicola sp.]|uniref:PIN domain-containing protein n=1 Tax=Tabrizicola sp. TaxID=2005166 RepID=UPI003F41003C